ARLSIGGPSGVRCDCRYPELSIGDPAGVRWDYRGMQAEAVKEFIRAMTIQGAAPDRLAIVKQAFDQDGLKGFWRKWLEFQQARIRSGRLDPSYVALVYVYIGEKKHAMSWLRRSAEKCKFTHKN